MTEMTTKLPRTTAKVIMLLGLVLYLPYLIYLPFPDAIVKQGASDLVSAEALGLMLYVLATAGAAFVAWGMIMAKVDSVGVNRQTVFKASAVGMGLLGVMRLLLAAMPHAPFDSILFVPISEGILCLVIAVMLYRSSI